MHSDPFDSSSPHRASPAQVAGVRRIGWACLCLVLGLGAFRHASLERFAIVWDDALFFKRVAYNILHHGFAGWNQLDGPVFVNTSQLFQGIALGLLWLFPGHYDAAVTFWGALAIGACFPLLAAAAQANAPGVLLLFCLLQAPPVLLSLETGMETPTVLLVFALLSWRLSQQRAEPSSFELVLFQLVIYALRPDAILLSLGCVVALQLLQRRYWQALGLVGASVLGVALESLAFRAYYGTAFPLSMFLKLSPLSVYDSDYLSLDLVNKLKNLAQIALLLLPLAPLIAARRDRLNVSLCAAGSFFIAFHALTTYEIAAYHARFYAPALPFFFLAALRGVESAYRKGWAQRLLVFGLLAGVLVLVLYFPNGIENARRAQASRVTLFEYARYFVGVPLLALWMLGGRGSGRAPAAWAIPVLVGGLAALQALSVFPRSSQIASDDISNTQTVESHTADVGIDVIQRCFLQPLQIVHSEIGLPGVMFPEWRVIDVTGLANPSIVEQRFDFEALCRRDRPEFVFRPHPTHRALNLSIDQSPCVAENYVLAPLPRKSSCPLLVRKDLLQRYLDCGRLRAGEAAPAHGRADRG
ncbi:MAG: hypothetical protein ABI895_07270 [Deltaproteobacteria bacterium]